MTMRQTDAYMSYIVRVQGKRMGHPDNIRNHNCRDLATMMVARKAAICHPDSHKVEVLHVLETWVKE